MRRILVLITLPFLLMAWGVRVANALAGRIEFQLVGPPEAERIKTLLGYGDKPDAIVKRADFFDDADISVTRIEVDGCARLCPTMVRYFKEREFTFVVLAEESVLVFPEFSRVIFGNELVYPFELTAESRAIFVYPTSKSPIIRLVDPG